MHVKQTSKQVMIDGEGGRYGLRNFDVSRDATTTAHKVQVRESLDGTPQSERCDCQGHQYRGSCSHIRAVYESGELFIEYYI
jgi:cytidylate kinase